MLMDPVETGIKGVELQEKTTPSGIKAVYSISGTELPTNTLNKQGVYVVKYNNGTSQKVVVK